jgi:hypothetical protein
MGEEFVKVAANKVSALEEAAKTLLKEWGQELKPVEVTVVSTDLRHNPDLDAVFGA